MDIEKMIGIGLGGDKALYRPIVQVLRGVWVRARVSSRMGSVDAWGVRYHQRA